MAESNKKHSRLCDINCNECAATENKQVALLLNILALRFGTEVWWITNHICPNLTCCPICHVDDFCHFDDDDGAFVTPITRIQGWHKTCDVAKEAVAVFEEIQKIQKGGNPK